ncbi:MAG: EutN/CcmL family microcompartment protein [Planctomycetota bacterium]|nr:MAG: EutN/CcmL family microcompartment protein [Planctomycetota bacterium]
MFIGKVTGSVVSTQKIESVVGLKLLLVQAYNIKNGRLEVTPRTAVAADTLGAGEGEFVLVTQGSSARLTDRTKNVPCDAVIVGIIDAMQEGTNEVYKKQKD